MPRAPWTVRSRLAAAVAALACSALTLPAYPAAADAPVAAAAFTNQPTPTIVGSSAAGSTLQVDTGVWLPEPTAQGVQWSLDGVPVDAATTASFVTTNSMIGRAVTVTVTVVDDQGAAESVTSDPLVVTGGSITNSVAPTITGTPVVNGHLGVSPGTWSVEPTSYDIYWYANGSRIAGASGPTWSPTYHQVGMQITATVVAHRAGYADASVTTAATATVATATFTTAPLSIGGTPAVGARLAADRQVWSPEPQYAEYQWFVDGVEVSGATGQTWTPSQAQAGRTVTVSVTGYRDGFAPATVTSAATATVSGGLFSSTPAPVVTGSTAVGAVLSATVPQWTPAATFTYQWLADGEVLTGAIGQSLTTTSAMLGRRISVRITANRVGYTPVQLTSAQTDVISGGVLTSFGVLGIVGTPVVGQPLTAQVPTWSDSPSLSWQWFADGTAIAGAASASFTPSNDEAGRALSVQVTALRPGYAAVTRTSGSTSIVTGGTFVSSPRPYVTGDSRPGQVLTAHAATAWTPTAAASYQWFRGDAPIVGANTANLTLTDDLIGVAPRVVVTATRAGFVPASSSAVAANVVQSGHAVTVAGTPVISGSAVIGGALAATAPTFSAGAQVGYQWIADGQPIGGATGSSLAVGPALVGTRISVRVTGQRPGYLSVSATSSATAAVGILTLVKGPQLSGKASVGGTLRTSAGTWAHGQVAANYRWYANGRAIPRATRSSLKLTSALRGKRVSAVVTVSRVGYVSQSRSTSGHWVTR